MWSRSLTISFTSKLTSSFRPCQDLPFIVKLPNHLKHTTHPETMHGRWDGWHSLRGLVLMEAIPGGHKKSHLQSNEAWAAIAKGPALSMIPRKETECLQITMHANYNAVRATFSATKFQPRNSGIPESRRQGIELDFTINDQSCFLSSQTSTGR